MDATDLSGSYSSAGSPVQEVIDPVLERAGVRLLVKRDDLIHKHISGNKWRKLQYNLGQAVQENHHTILTFGGAYSNHIAAAAFACKKAGMESIGIIRGENDQSNPSLNFAREHGMELRFVSREKYKLKNHADFIDRLETDHGRFYLIPEGGANGLGVRGCAEILSEVEEKYDVVCCPVGTATTLAGLAISANSTTKLIGFSALKGAGFLLDEMIRLAEESALRYDSLNVEFNSKYHFGGYAKVKPELISFIDNFNVQTGVLLDPIYTGKMMFGIYDMLQKGEFVAGTTILAIHTGGLQGWHGMIHRKLI